MKTLNHISPSIIPFLRLSVKQNTSSILLAYNGMLFKIIKSALRKRSYSTRVRDGCSSKEFLLQFKSEKNRTPSFIKTTPGGKVPVIWSKMFSHNGILKSATYCTASETPASSSIGRHCYHEDVEKAVNEQVTTELNAGYAYLSMATFFGRTTIALPGSQGFFLRMYEEEIEHAFFFINYQLTRGGHVQFCPITFPDHNWKSIQNALCTATEMEKSVKDKLVNLYNIAEQHHDLHVMDVISGQFLEEQERSICEMSRLFVRATQMASNEVGQYLFDKELHNIFVKEKKAAASPVKLPPEYI